MHGMIMGHSMGIVALITLALGYIVCSLAKKEKGLLKAAGYIIGIAIIAISSVTVLCKVLWTAKMCLKMCPLRQFSMPMPSAPPALPK